MPSHFEEIYEGKKTFELRENNRDFSVGDTLELQEYNLDESGILGYTGRKISVIVTHIFHGGKLGLAPNYCIMSIKVLED